MAMRTAMEVQMHSEVCAYMAYLLDHGVDGDCVSVDCRGGRIYITAAYCGQTVTRWMPFSNEALQLHNRQPFIENLVEAVLGHVALMTKKEIIERRREAWLLHYIWGNGNPKYIADLNDPLHRVST